MMSDMGIQNDGMRQDDAISDTTRAGKVYDTDKTMVPGQARNSGKTDSSVTIIGTTRAGTTSEKDGTAMRSGDDAMSQAGSVTHATRGG